MGKLWCKYVGYEDNRIIQEYRILPSGDYIVSLGGGADLRWQKEAFLINYRVFKVDSPLWRLVMSGGGIKRQVLDE